MGDTNVDIAELEKQHAELGEQIVKLGGKVKYPETDDADLKAKKSVPRIKLDKAKKKGGAAEDALDGGDDEDMEDDSGEDTSNPGDTGKGKAKKAAEKEPVEKKETAVDDETLVYKGETIKKSVVGDAQFSLFKGMNEDIQKAAERIEKAEEAALMAKLEKQADDSFAHVPGTTQERATMLKALAKMDANVRKTFEAVFTQSEKLAKAAFEKVGSKGGDMEDLKKSKQDFETKVSEIAKRDSIKKADAMSKARTEHPELFKAYQEAEAAN